MQPAVVASFDWKFNQPIVLIARKAVLWTHAKAAGALHPQHTHIMALRL